MKEEELIKILNPFIDGVKDDWNYILPQELEQELKGEHHYFLLDVRRPEDFHKYHIKGAVNIFWLEILKPENLKKLPKDKRIVIICYVGHTASQALVLLRLLGYDAVVLKYGMGHASIKGVPISGWLNFSFDTESS
jgi:rhodanese-related sulfurtransferase